MVHLFIYCPLLLFCLLQQGAHHSSPLKICTHAIQVFKFIKYGLVICDYQHFWYTGIIYFVVLTAVERNNLMRLANTIPFTSVSIQGNFCLVILHLI